MYTVTPDYSGNRTVPVSYRITVLETYPDGTPMEPINIEVPNTLVTKDNLGTQTDDRDQPVPTGNTRNPDEGVKMSSAIDVDSLMELISPPQIGGITVDWERIARSWGRPFPADYQRFIEVYGAGAIQDFLVIIPPQLKEPPEDAGWNGMVHETDTAEDTWNATSKPSELEGNSPNLITWGVSVNADLFCWDTTAEDPATWPVLLYDRSVNSFSRHNCGMVEFVTRTLRGEFPTSPLNGDVTLWRRGKVTWEND